MTHGSLFSGIGGFDLAAEWMGWDNKFHCEINEWCAKVLKYHFPNSKHYADITQTDFTEWFGRIDVLTGGFPCQPFSIAGSRKGAGDDRYLWPHMLRVIREVRPTWVIGENVAGIVSMVQPGSEIEVEHQATLFEKDNKETILEQEYVIETVCSDLERIGYSIQPLLIPACAVGAPHRRDRVWFVAHSSDARPESLRRKRENEVYEPETIADTNCDGNTRKPGETARYGSERIAPNPDKLNGYISRLHTGEVSQFKASGVWENQNTQIDEHTDGERCKELDAMPIPNEKTRISRFGFIEDWSHWPTQPPVCGRDDGISFGLDGITFPKWRNESIKSFGNAIVPQDALQLFRAIELVTKTFKLH